MTNWITTFYVVGRKNYGTSWYSTRLLWWWYRDEKLDRNTDHPDVFRQTQSQTVNSHDNNPLDPSIWGHHIMRLSCEKACTNRHVLYSISQDWEMTVQLPMYKTLTMHDNIIWCETVNLEIKLGNPSFITTTQCPWTQNARAVSTSSAF
jgi:hypothetical protein